MTVEIISELPLLLTVTKSSLTLFKDLWTAYTQEGEPDEGAVEEADAPAPETLEAVFTIKNEVHDTLLYTLYSMHGMRNVHTLLCIVYILQE